MTNPIDDKGKSMRRLPAGAAKDTVSVPIDSNGHPDDYACDPASKTLRAGAGEFAPVEPEV